MIRYIIFLFVFFFLFLCLSSPLPPYTMVLVKRYGLLPSTANKKAIKSYTLAIPKAELTRMNTLVELSNISTPNYENTGADKSQEFGITREWLMAAKERWQNNFIWYVISSFININNQRISEQLLMTLFTIGMRERSSSILFQITKQQYQLPMKMALQAMSPSTSTSQRSSPKRRMRRRYSLYTAGLDLSLNFCLFSSYYARNTLMKTAYHTTSLCHQSQASDFQTPLQ